MILQEKIKWPNCLLRANILYIFLVALCYRIPPHSNLDACSKQRIWFIRNTESLWRITCSCCTCWGLGRLSDLPKWGTFRSPAVCIVSLGLPFLYAQPLPVIVPRPCKCQLQIMNQNLSWQREIKRTLACALFLTWQGQINQKHVTEMLFSCMKSHTTSQLFIAIVTESQNTNWLKFV